MRLQERIDTINVVRIPRLTDGHANTIGDFYTQVIGPMLPTREVVLAWQGLIYDYASDVDDMSRTQAVGRVQEERP